MKKTYVLLLAACIATKLHAQQNKKQLRFSAIASGGYMKGELQEVTGFKTVLGLQHKNWFGGVGAAYDRYGYKSIPVFLSARRFFGKDTRWQAFVYGDAGYNISIYTDQLPRKIGDNIANRFHPSFYGEAGIGLSKKISKLIRLNFFGGYSEKQFRYTSYNNFSFLSYWSPTGNTTDYHFYYRRLVLGIGLQL